VVIGDKGLERGVAEYRERRATESIDVPLERLAAWLRERTGQPH
jgi:hypothetical protein